MYPSNFLNLNQRDFLKGLVMFVGSAVFALVAESAEKGVFTFDWTQIWHTAVAATFIYLGKNFFSGAKAQPQPTNA